VIAASSITSFAPVIQTLTQASSAASQLLPIIDRRSKLDPLGSSGKQPSPFYGGFEIHNLNFAYPSRPSARILYDFSLSIPASKTTALVGPSGCGKSTLIGLLERWYEPDSGEILIDGHNISDCNVKWLRSSIRLVQQEPVLFRGTVYENVARGFLDHQRNLPKEEQKSLVEDACKSSYAHEFINDLPNGYNTEVGENAGMLSGGQRQRLAIARSIISDPKVLLLDEATSALDPEAEKIVQEALDNVSKGRTTLVIAHKLATVQKADNIVVISYGRIVEQGAHHELVSNDGLYASLVHAQNLGEGGEDEHDTGTPQLKERDSEDLGKISTSKKPVPIASATILDTDTKKLSRGTMGYSLLRCLKIMLAEQKSLYIYYAVSSIACLVGGATYPAQAILFSRLFLVFQLKGTEARSQANFYALMFFVIALGNLLAYFVMGWIANTVSQTVTRRYRAEMYENILQQDMDFFDRPENASGALASKLSVIPEQLQELMSFNMLLISIVIINIIASSAVAIAFGWKLGLVIVFGGLPPLLLSAYVRARLDQRLERRIGERFYESASLATEAIAAIKTVSSLTLEPSFFDEFNELASDIVNKTILSTLFTLFWFSLAQSMEFLLMALGFWYGAQLIADGEYTAQQFFTIFLSVIFGGQAAATFVSYSNTFTKATSAANYILWLRNQQPKISEADSNYTVKPSYDGDLALTGVSFQYNQSGSRNILNSVSMKILPGQMVAIVGASGCGKSTVISLLERFYDPTSGHITLTDIDISKLSPRLYRSHISLVSQEPILFQGTLRHNIILGLEHEPSNEEIYDACRQANILEFIDSLPEGFSTQCGSRGGQFSGGQRQRITIARALIRNPRLLLLDEATSALDTTSEKVVQEALMDAGNGRIMVAVAHRLSTIRDADWIFVMGGGRIVESGTHRELLRKRGVYYAMCKAQGLDVGS
jgi:ATP-binding cassette subfamily B (MDR/TAP) protein 1